MTRAAVLVFCQECHRAELPEKCDSLAPGQSRLSHQHYLDAHIYDINIRLRTGVLGMSRGIDGSIGETVWCHMARTVSSGSVHLTLCEHATGFVFLTSFSSTPKLQG